MRFILESAGVIVVFVIGLMVKDFRHKLREHEIKAGEAFERIIVMEKNIEVLKTRQSERFDTYLEGKREIIENLKLLSARIDHLQEAKK